MPKSSILVNPIMRSKEEFAEYFPKALNTIDQTVLRRMGIRMADMVDVWRTIYMEGFMTAANIQLEELNAIKNNPNLKKDANA